MKEVSFPTPHTPHPLSSQRSGLSLLSIPGPIYPFSGSFLAKF
ncbi:hypothetical protein O53_5365 [Microcystis aeruginosa TAIHU98]|uniref:Uncharacterized protein n=1 Tax=Microcystis aeruginosa TAIHU98 TaxID=1134457 RepID=L7DZ72_MICAE|nr:hypothetical protein O53_5365 [Microcystis aeruginosa TAIHU98]ODV37637.1 DNA gyrase subunit A [Microcystis aeruginosa NIES-98]